MVGEILAGRFELVDVLDVGGAGTIWRSWDHHAREYVAAKVLRHCDDDSIIRFIQESKRIIDHPHTTVPRNWIGIDDKILFTMDIIVGGSVATLLRDFGSLPEGWVTELARQTTAALTAVHAAGFAHRDVKPANLLLDATGTATPHLRLSDFGTAARFDGPRLTMTSAVVGTSGYLSPEARHGAEPAPAQDIYALGITLHELVSGSVPDTPTAPPRNVTPALAEMIDAMTANDPCDRPQTVTEVAAHLETLPGATGIGYAADPANPIEIYDQIPPLPAGWASTGPIRAERVAPASAPSPEPARSQHRSATTDRGGAPPADAPPLASREPDASSAARSPRHMQLLAAIALAIVGVVLLGLAIRLA